LRKQGIILEEYFSAPVRRRLNELLVGCKVYKKVIRGGKSQSYEIYVGPFI
jgi:hypothetical protein